MKRSIVATVLLVLAALLMIACTGNKKDDTDTTAESRQTTAQESDPTADSDEPTTTPDKETADETTTGGFAETSTEETTEESKLWNPDVIAYYDIDNGSSCNTRPDNGWFLLYTESPNIATKDGHFRSATPLLGTYDQADPAVARQHLYWLRAAGFTAIAVDLTNIIPLERCESNDMRKYCRGCMNNFEVLLREAKKMCDEGISDVPKIYANLRLSGENTEDFLMLLGEYRAIYEKYPGQTYHLRGSDKPFLGVFIDWELMNRGAEVTSAIDLGTYFEWRFTNGFLLNYAKDDKKGGYAIDADRKMWIFAENERGKEEGSYLPIYTAYKGGKAEMMAAAVAVWRGWETDGSPWDAMNHRIGGKTPLERTLAGVYQYQPDYVVINRFNYPVVWMSESQEGMGLWHSTHYEPSVELGFTMFNAVAKEVRQMRNLSGKAPETVRVLHDQDAVLSIDLSSDPLEYRISKNTDLSGAEWTMLHITSGISYESLLGNKTLYIQTRNLFGESPITEITVQSTEAPEPTSFVFDFSPNGNGGMYRKEGNAWVTPESFSAPGITDSAIGGNVIYASMHVDEDASVLSSLETDFTVPGSGTYAIRFSYMKNGTSPVIRLFIDGQQIGSDIDMDNGGGMTADSADLGTVTLTAGKHTLRIEAPATNSGRWEIFLDALFFVPVG